MSSGTQVDVDWAGSDAGQTGAGASAPGARNAPPTGKYLTDEEILGIELNDSGTLRSDSANGQENRQRDSSGTIRPQNDNGAEFAAPRNDNIQRNGNDPKEAARDTGHESRFTNHESHNGAAMPAWMRAAAADPQHGGEAAQLWREHQEFRAAFTSPEEARAVRELLPGGVRDVLSLREATQSVERIDAALFSGDARAQAEVVAELARANPAAFRSLFAEAAKLVAGGLRLEAGNQQDFVIPSGARNLSGDGMNGPANLQRDSSSPRGAGAPQNDNTWSAGDEPPVTTHRSPLTGHESPFANAQGERITSHQSPVTSHSFDSAAYAAFERSTNDAVARDVRGAIGDTLARVLPEGVADGAARRIGDDIFQEIHRALAADRTLSEQVAAVLRVPATAGGLATSGGPRFGSAEQQRVASLLVGRAKQLVPSVARRVIGEWTSSVLNTSRAKAARQATAASRVDIAAPGGSRAAGGSLLARGGSRQVDYGSMSDEEILGM